jgi:hypothetical protein
MFDHVSIGVKDTGRSGRFYDAALKPLGYTRLSDGEGSLGYGDKSVVLWVNASEKQVKADPASGLHFTPPRWRLAARTMASPGCGRIMARATTPPSPSIRMAIASRRIAESSAERNAPRSRAGLTPARERGELGAIEVRTRPPRRRGGFRRRQDRGRPRGSAR